ncbi:hypothetical protein NLI96_g5172 [Meripilus lineatus]|uniref:MYND-type domain-containing protein n=1 Tax=Meripilus lineatus TaxID=2056292 RepID=A0AAD5V3A4_9APHY|nr:hypothetical protein NLI96_g5172 [Physisporinus lineatus]
MSHFAIELTQCQNCWKPKGPGVTFFRLQCIVKSISIAYRAYRARTSYQVAYIDCLCFQSKECQKKAWPSHKEKCKLNRRSPVDENDPLKCLQKFTSKHRPALADAAVRALDLSLDIGRSLHFVLAIFLRRRKDSRRPETSYFATGAEVLPFEAFHPEECEEMKEQVRKADKVHKKNGMDGGLFVVLMCLEEGTTNIAPVGFTRNTFYPPGTPWKEFLFALLNEGVVN